MQFAESETFKLFSKIIWTYYNKARISDQGEDKCTGVRPIIHLAHLEYLNMWNESGDKCKFKVSLCH